MSKDTLSSIAAKCGCSISTVSRVLNGYANKFRISETTVKRVLAEVNASNYVPSALAKGLRTGKTGTIGLIIPSVDDVFFAAITSAIINEARKRNYTVIIIDTQENPENEKKSIHTLISQNVEGIIAITCTSGSLSSDISAFSTPIVYMDRFKESLEGSTFITTNNYKGAYHAVEYLIQRGHKDILCLQGDPETNTSQERVQGYKDAMMEHSLSGKIRICGSSYSYEEGYLQARKEWDRKKHCSAMFILSGRLTRGVLKAFKELSVNVPEDISIISFDDNPVYDCISPGITCIDQPISALSAAAMEALKDAIDGNSHPGRVTLDPKIIERNSVKIIP